MGQVKTRFHKPYRVLIPPGLPVHVIQVGVGGTGSLLAAALGRLAYHAHRRGIKMSLTLIDHDTVDTSNIGRQWFSPCEVGYNKAQAMSARLNAAFGLEVTGFDVPFVAEMMPTYYAYPWEKHYRPQSIALLVGAVDNTAARAQMAQAVERGKGNVWCLDMGNARHNGAILIGNLRAQDIKHVKLTKMGLCTALPSPYAVAPGLIVPEPPPATPSPAASCAELVIAEEQGLMVNQAVAAYAAQYCYNFIIRRELTCIATRFNLDPPTAVSTLITRPGMARIKRQVRAYARELEVLESAERAEALQHMNGGRQLAPGDTLDVPNATATDDGAYLPQVIDEDNAQWDWDDEPDLAEEEPDDEAPAPETTRAHAEPALATA